MELDVAIRQAYLSSDESADTIVTRPSAYEEFCAEVNELCGAALEPEVIGKRLLALRKRGEKKGGLPRKPR